MPALEDNNAQPKYEMSVTIRSLEDDIAGETDPGAKATMEALLTVLKRKFGEGQVWSNNNY